MKDKNKHTPSPWKFDGMNIYKNYDSESYLIACVERHSPDVDLMKASPDLLEALENLINALDDLPPISNNTVVLAHLKATKAIKKAKGE